MSETKEGVNMTKASQARHALSKGVLALAAAVLLAAGLAAGGILAPNKAYADPNGATSPNLVSVTKAVVSEDGGATPAGEFTFTATAVSVDNDTAQKGPQLNDFTISVPAGKGVAVGTALGTAFLPADANAFGHAGVYRYTLAEKTGTLPGIEYSTQTYTLDVYIANDGNGGLKYGQVLAYTETTPGTPGDPDKKIDPTPGSSEDKYTDLDPKASQLMFTNKLANHDNFLQVSKVIAGDFSNQNQTFAFTVSLTLPAGFTTDSVVAKHFDGANTSDVEFTFAPGNQTATANVTMGAKHTIDFPKSLPAGTTVTVAEAKATIANSTKAWTPSAKFNGADVANDAAEGYSGTVTLAYDNGNENKFVVTNTDDRTVPTGILINNAPAFLMIGLAIAGVVLYLVSRKRAQRVRS